jgi:acyl carrier protein
MAFDRNDTYNKVVTVIAEELKLDKNAIKAESTFQDLGADSLDMVQIIMKLEEQFGVEINDEDAEKMTNLDQVVAYIHARRTK